MDILSTGEKIKRARIYKGITLKELCLNEISISKMSCIENSKVKADEKILKYVADKLQIDFNYLVRDVYDQLVYNLEEIKENKFVGMEFEANIIENLSYANEYEYYNIAFELTHLLFNYYIEEAMDEKIQLYISNYYDLYQKNNSKENTIIYLKDRAKFSFNNEEYSEAISDYAALREIMTRSSGEKDDEFYVIEYFEGLSYSKIHDTEKAYKLISEVIAQEEKIKDLICMREVFQTYAILCINNGDKDVCKYIEKVEKYENIEQGLIAKAKAEYGEAYFGVSENKKAVSEILGGIKLFPKEDKREYVKFISNCIEVLYKNNEYNEAFKLTEEALNFSIDIDNMKLIEKIYYFKGSLLQKLGKYSDAEIFMNLSLDSLFKCGSKEERYKRYLDMGYLYYKLDEIKESVKYFSLANTILK